jgi:hypothetical protein
VRNSARRCPGDWVSGSRAKEGRYIWSPKRKRNGHETASTTFSER